jgi:anti-anti-sigma regulatory factor
VADRIKTLIAKNQPRVMVMDMSGVPDIEYSALQMLVEGEQRFAGQGVSLWLTGLNPAVLETVRHAGLAERLGRERMPHNAHAAIEQFLAMPAAPGGTAPVAAT